jgi:hypothetical protein
VAEEIGPELAVRGHVCSDEPDARERDHPDEEAGAQGEAREHYSSVSSM